MSTARGLFLTQSLETITGHLATGELSAADLRVEMNAVIRRYEDSVHAWVSVDPDLLMDTHVAQPIPAYGYRIRQLQGIPFGAKDVFNAKAFLTERGSPNWRGYRAGNNARVVDSLERFGASLIGKTTTSELAVDEEAPTYNPHNLLHSPGTSSGGSAVACATGMVPFALATQSGASIARPASFTGVFGLKPSIGLVPRTGVLKTADTLDTVGFLTSRVDNLGVVLEGIRVRGPDYPLVYSTIDKKPKARTSRPRKQIGALRTPFWQQADVQVRDAFDHHVDRISTLPDVDVREMPWPSFLDSVHELHDIIYCKSLSYYFREDPDRPHANFSDVLAERLLRGDSISTQEYKLALERQDEITAKLDALLQSFPAIITLSTTQTAPLRGNFPKPDPSLIWTFTGVPAIAYPLHLSRDGLPIGVQIVGPRWSDFKLIKLLEEFSAQGLIGAAGLEILGFK